jgi:hypothetical protein
MAPCINSRSCFLVVCNLLFSMLAGCANMPEVNDAATGSLSVGAPVLPDGAIDDVVLVDCLLPGQIRQLGTRMTFLAPRRAVKSTKSDCGIRGGEFVLFDRSDYSTAFQALQPKAQAGDPVAQTYVGEIYEKGLGLTAPDYAMAASWYRRAADQSHAPAQTNLGSLYERGLGVPKDKAKALDLYRRASGLTEDRLIFESTLKDQQDAFRREIAVRNHVAAALRTRLQQASVRRSGTSTKSPSSAADEQALRHQAESQRRDAESEAERVRKELHAVEQIKQSDMGASQSADSGKSAQLGKLELTRNEQYQALLETSRQLSFVPK